MQSALREDALTSVDGGIAVRVGLPWIRSLPLACLREPAITVDGVAAPTVLVGDRRLTPEQLVDEGGWWFA